MIDTPLALHADSRAPLAEAYDPNLAPPPVLPVGPSSQLDDTPTGDTAGD